MKIKYILLCIVIVVSIAYQVEKAKNAFKHYSKQEVTKKERFNPVSKCKKFYMKNAYEGALTCVEPYATGEYANNPIIKYLYAVALFHNGEIEKAKDEFQHVKSNVTEYDIIEDCEKYLDKIAHIANLKRHDIGHYFTDLTKVAVWEKPRRLKVYISSDYDKKELINGAFLNWDRALSDMVNFIYVDNPKDADIIARAVKRSQINIDGAIGETRYQTYYYTNNPSRKFFAKAEILIAVNYDNELTIGDKIFTGIILHEIGHALGIISHSPSIGDAMYFSADSYAIGRITNRDINTVKRIYGNI